MKKLVWTSDSASVTLETRDIDRSTFERDAEVFLDIAVATGVGLWSVDLTSRLCTVSAETSHILGLDPRGDTAVLRLSDRIHPADLAERRRPESAVEALPDGTFRIVRADTSDVAWVTSRSRTVQDRGGRAIRIVGTLRDVTRSKRAESDCERAEARLEAALRIGRMVLWDLDVGTGIVTRSANAVDVLGVQEEPIVDFFGRVHPDDRSMVNWETSANPAPPTDDVRFRYQHPSGRKVWLETGASKVHTVGTPGHIIGITTDVTARRLAEERLIYAADHDPLTGLLSRKAWATLIDGLASDGRQDRSRFLLLLLDVDFFKTINDTLGHDGGDAVLRAIGERMRGATPPLVAAARLGGDEFAVVVDAGRENGRATGAVDALIESLGAPVAYGDRSVPISFSVGVARFPDDATTVADLIKNADLALYAAKEGGKGTSATFSPQMRVAMDARVSLLEEFREDLEEGRVIPFYQPKVDLATGALVGFEALARWVHPRRGVLTPATFGPAFEDADLARRIGARVRAAVLADLGRWRDRGTDPGRVAVNCASHDFDDGCLAGRILRDLAAAGIPADRFEIEVTESVMMDRHADLVGRAMAELREAGVRISLDDFGTGYASLIHLKRFPVHEIKIDPSFVSGMGHGSDTAIIEAIIAIGRSMGLATVAEGVETVTQRDALLAMGCEQAQGFLFGKAMHPDRVPWFVNDVRERAHARLSQSPLSGDPLEEPAVRRG